MNQEIKGWLNNRLEDRKWQLKHIAEIDRRTYRHYDPDLDYAEWEITAGLTDAEVWDGWENYDEITTSALWENAVFIQAVANMVGL